MSLKVRLLAVICYWALIAEIKADCTIRTAEDSTVKPKFFRNFETAATLIPDKTHLIQLDNNERIMGYCRSAFVDPQSRTETFGSTLTLICEQDNIRIKDWNNWRLSSFECLPDRTFGTCSIQMSSDKALGPTFFKKLGTRTIQVLPEMEIITISDAQEITAHCDTKFKSPYHQDPDLKLICIRGHILAMGHRFNADYSRSLECESYKWNLYESTTPFPWCPSSMASYLLARPQAHSTCDYEHLAGICYDFDQMSVKSILYAANPKQARHLAPRILESFKPLMEIADVDINFISKRSFEYDNPNMQDWFIFSNYINGVIIQYPMLPNDSFPQFDKLLTIDWWLGLKRGNWMLYEEAVNKHIDNDNHDYDILAGVSKEVSVPMRKKDCINKLTRVDLIESENYKLPLYVWNYVRSLKNCSDDVVVIGVNTPFVDFYDAKQLLFCNDICHTIDWLKDVRRTFRYRSMGIIICCTADEVFASKRLDGFAEPTPPTLLPILSYPPFMATTEQTSITARDTTTEQASIKTTDTTTDQTSITTTDTTTEQTSIKTTDTTTEKTSIKTTDKTTEQPTAYKTTDKRSNLLDTLRYSYIGEGVDKK